MKKILSVVLTLVMVLSTFAMIVPTASAAGAEIVLFEENFDDASYAGKTNYELLKAIFGESGVACYKNATYDDATTVVAALEETEMGGKALNINANSNYSAMAIQFANDTLIETNGVILEMEYILGARAVNTSSDNRYFGLMVGSALSTSASNQIVGMIYNNFNASNNSLRYGHWDKALKTTQGQAFYNQQNTRVKYHCEITATYVKLYVAEWNATAGAYGDLQLVAEMNNTVHGSYETKYAEMDRVVASLLIQNGNNVTIDNVKLTTVIGATFPEAPAVTTSAGKVLYTQDFSNAAYAGKTDTELANAIFGEGNTNAAAMKAGMSIVDGALKIDATPAGADFMNLVLAKDAVVSEGYVAEMDYTFNEGCVTNDNRLISFGTNPVNHTAWTDLIVVGPYSSSFNARVAWRDGANGNAWMGVTGYGTPDHVNTLETKYRMRATISPDLFKLEVAKYTDGVLGAYVTIGEYAQTGAARNMRDNLTLTIQKGVVATVDNIVVTSVTSTATNAFVGYQRSANALRLVGALDEATYETASAVGFEVAILGMGQLKSLECNYVYETIGSDTAASLNAGYDYLYAMHIEAMPAGDYTIMVVPYYVQGGATVYGEAMTFAVTIEDPAAE